VRWQAQLSLFEKQTAKALESDRLPLNAWL
jgi:hypothetical protein